MNRIVLYLAALLSACAVASCSSENSIGSDTSNDAPIETPIPGGTEKTVSWGDSRETVLDLVSGNPEESDGNLFYRDANGGMTVYGFTNDALSSVIVLQNENIANKSFINWITSGYSLLGGISEESDVYVNEETNTLMQIRRMEIDKKAYKAFISIPIAGDAGSETNESYYSVATDYHLITLVNGGQYRRLLAHVAPKGSLQTVEWMSENPSVASVDDYGYVFPESVGETDIIATSVYGVSDKCHVVVINVPDDAVDMGYGVYWAKTNYEANSPEEVGTKLRWGREGRETYDDDQNLRLEDDQVYIGTNGVWRTPTKDEIKSLRDNSTWSNTTINGVKGRNIKSKKTGETIFLPITTDSSSSNYRGTYWTSTCYMRAISYSYYLIFTTTGDSLGSDFCKIKDASQSQYMAVRPVYYLPEE